VFPACGRTITKTDFWISLFMCFRLREGN